MRETIFQAILSKLQSLAIFNGEEGTVRVYDFPTTAPAGYPFAVVSSSSLESTVLDNARDERRYNFTVSIVGEKFGETTGKTQSEALKAMRTAEDAVLALFDSDYDLSVAGVIRTFPQNASYSYVDGNSRVLWTMELRVDTVTNITL